MAKTVDILSLEALERADSFSALPEAHMPLGVLFDGPHLSGRAGSGFDIYDVSDFQPGDKRVNIPASVKVGTPQATHWEDERSVPLVVVSDILRDPHGHTPGERYSARSIGMLAAHAVMRMGIAEQSPVSAVWTNGFETRFANSSRYQSHPKGVQAIMREGLAMATDASDKIANPPKGPKKGLLRRATPGQPPAETETLADGLAKAVNVAKKLMSARMVVISDFRSIGTDARGRSWDELLKTLARQNQVVTIEITNPLHRALVDKVEEYRGASSGVAVEGSQQRIYAEAVEQRNTDIDAKLARASHYRLSLDTADPDWARSFGRQLGKTNQ